MTCSRPRDTGSSSPASPRPTRATVIDNRGEEALVIDGPFIESKEYLVGFWIIEAPDLDVALELATEGSKFPARAGRRLRPRARESLTVRSTPLAERRLLSAARCGALRIGRRSPSLQRFPDSE